MGLSLEVGMLADLTENDPESETDFRECLASLNKYLESIGLDAHREPEECEVWSAQMYGYSGLHYLRRLAAHVDSSGDFPTPGDAESSKDPVLNRYFEDVDRPRPGLLQRIMSRRTRFARRFDHLIVHSDAEGFYLPADFSDVLISPPEFAIPGAMVGSVPRLLDELTRLAVLLEIPDTLDAQSDALWDAAEQSQGVGDARWQQYGVESFSCVVLREGCRHSLRTGAALVFS